jgi:hypothetical protein
MIKILTRKNALTIPIHRTAITETSHSKYINTRSAKNGKNDVITWMIIFLLFFTLYLLITLSQLHNSLESRDSGENSSMLDLLVSTFFDIFISQNLK